MFNLLIGYQYRSAAVVADDPATGDPSELLLVDELRGQPGTRVPHAWLTGVINVSPHLIYWDRDSRCSPEMPETLGAQAPMSRPRPWECLSPPTESVSTSDIVDVDGEWAARTGLTPEAALLVRPDDVVGWRGDNIPADPDGQFVRHFPPFLAEGLRL